MGRGMGAERRHQNTITTDAADLNMSIYLSIKSTDLPIYIHIYLYLDLFIF